MKKSQLQKTIDGMVADSIRRILPDVMNEVLLRTVAASGLMEQRKAEAPVRAQQRPAQIIQKAAAKQRPSGLAQLLDEDIESVGSDFYSMSEEGVPRRREEPAHVQQHSMTQRIQNLPPQLQALAEDVDMSNFGGGDSWDDDDAPQFEAPVGPPLERAAAATGIDFNRMAQTIRESANREKAPVGGVSASERQRFEEARLARQREQLETKA